MTKIFIDGREGTTGLRIYDRLASRDDIELIILKTRTEKIPKKEKKL
jgi:N-acetyl-gamma-glutamyl-phosphate reductase